MSGTATHLLTRSVLLAISTALVAASLAPRSARGAEGRPSPEAVAPVRTLLLDPASLVSWLQQRSPEVAAAAARLGQAGADVGTAHLIPNPALDVTLSDVTVGKTNPKGLHFTDTYVLAFGLSETLEIGKRGPRIASASLRHGSAREAYRDAVVQKAAEARLALGRVVYLKAKLAVLGESLQSAENAIELERTRMQQGYTSGNDFDRLVLDTMSLRIELGRAATEHEIALAACAAALLAPCAPAGAQDSDIDMAAPLPPSLGEAEGSLARRPDIRALDRARESARQDAVLARRRAIPDPNFRLGFVYDRLVVSGDQPRTFMFTMTIPLPVFDRGQHDAARAQSRALELGSTARAALERARGDVSGLARRKEFLERTLRTLTNDAVPRSKAILDTTTAAFARGQVSMTDLLLARRTHIALMVNLMDVRFDYLQTRNELRRVLGLDAELVRGPAARGP
jgi:outer membrane protein, heavy metal efflux system